MYNNEDVAQDHKVLLSFWTQCWIYNFLFIIAACYHLINGTTCSEHESRVWSVHLSHQGATITVNLLYIVNHVKAFVFFKYNLFPNHYGHVLCIVWGAGWGLLTIDFGPFLLGLSNMLVTITWVIKLTNWESIIISHTCKEKKLVLFLSGTMKVKQSCQIHFDKSCTNFCGFF